MTKNLQTKIKVEILKDMIKDLKSRIDEYRNDGHMTSLMAANAYESIMDKLNEELFNIEKGI